MRFNISESFMAYGFNELANFGQLLNISEIQLLPVLRYLVAALSNNATSGSLRPVMFFKPKYCLGHPENYVFLLGKNIFLASKYPKSISFHFE